MQIRKNDKLKLAIIASAIMGYVIGYSQIYLFHILCSIYIIKKILFACNGKKLIIKQKKILYPFLYFFIYILLSFIWHPDISVYFRYIFYFSCGLFLILVVYQSSDSKEQINIVFKVISIFVLLNIIIGFLESLGLIRLPMSPYSEYVSYFGRTGTDIQSLTLTQIDSIGKKPTGFDWNPNNFGFIVLISLPFIYFNNRKVIKYVGTLLSIWLLLSIGSKAHFLSFIVFLSFIPLYQKNISRKILYGFLAIVFFIFILTIQNYGINSNNIARMLDVFHQISIGIEYILSDTYVWTNSTTMRAMIYGFGIRELLNSYGFGLGFGGIEARLIQEKFPITSFHFFFLQMLVDCGFVIFILFIIYYLMLAIKLKTVSLHTTDENLSYYSKSVSLALLTAIPASIAPSGVHYLLGFYVLIGFALLIIKISKMENSNEGCNIISS